MRPEDTHPADVLREHLRTIRDHWDQMVPAQQSSSVARFGGSRSRTSTPKATDNGDHNSDVDRLDVILSLRADVLAVLNGWTQVALQDYEIKTCDVDGHDVGSLCEFLSKQAWRLVDHEAWPDLLDEVTDAAKAVHRVAVPSRKDWMIIGTCPIANDETGQSCGGEVRAWPDPTQDRDPRCMTCGTVAVVDWWMTRMLDDPSTKPLVTATELIGIIAYRLDWTVTNQQIWQWATRGKIQRAGKDAKGRTLYAHAEVVQSLTGELKRSAV